MGLGRVTGFSVDPWAAVVVLFTQLLFLLRDVSVELPFVLMHPKPHDHITLPRPQSGEYRPHPELRTGAEAGSVEK